MHGTMVQNLLLANSVDICVDVKESRNRCTETWNIEQFPGNLYTDCMEPLHRFYGTIAQISVNIAPLLHGIFVYIRDIIV